MQSGVKNGQSTTGREAGAQNRFSRNFWHRPDRTCGECVYGERYVHEGGIYVVVKCGKSDGFAFRGVYQRACGAFVYNSAMASFGKSYLEAGRRQGASRSEGGGVPQKGAEQSFVDEEEHAVPF